MTSSLKKLLADCFKTVADGPKTGLLAARAISNWRCALVGSNRLPIKKIADRFDCVTFGETILLESSETFCWLFQIKQILENKRQENFKILNRKLFSYIILRSPDSNCFRKLTKT